MIVLARLCLVRIGCLFVVVLTPSLGVRMRVACGPVAVCISLSLSLGRTRQKNPRKARDEVYVCAGKSTWDETVTYEVSDTGEVCEQDEDVLTYSYLGFLAHIAAFSQFVARG